MDWNLKITDMEGHTPEHSSVIVNFIAAIRQQLKNSTCYVYSDNIQYHFKDNQGNNRITDEGEEHFYNSVSKGCAWEITYRFKCNQYDGKQDW